MTKSEKNHEAILDAVQMVLDAAGIIADPETFTKICELDRIVCLSLGLDPDVHAMPDSLTT